MQIMRFIVFSILPIMLLSNNCNSMNYNIQQNMNQILGNGETRINFDNIPVTYYATPHNNGVFEVYQSINVQQKQNIRVQAINGEFHVSDSARIGNTNINDYMREHKNHLGIIQYNNKYYLGFYEYYESDGSEIYEWNYFDEDGDVNLLCKYSIGVQDNFGTKRILYISGDNPPYGERIAFYTKLNNNNAITVNKLTPTSNNNYGIHLMNIDNKLTILNGEEIYTQMANRHVLQDNIITGVIRYGKQNYLGLYVPLQEKLYFFKNTNGVEKLVSRRVKQIPSQN